MLMRTMCMLPLEKSASREVGSCTCYPISSQTSETKPSASTNAIQPLSSVAHWASIVNLLHTNSDDSNNEFRLKKIKHQTKRNKLGS